MDKWGLPEGFPAAQRIREAAGRGALTHALLLTGAGPAEATARFAAAALECTGPGPCPCGACPGCRKVLSGIHPDVTVVRDDGHESVAVDIVRGVRSDAYIRPNEGAAKVYIFPDCSLLTEQDQNVLLKIVEEGPPYAAFCFCAENPAAVLPTLRSRCVELPLRGESPEERGELSERAEALCRTMSEKKAGGPAELLCRLEQTKLSPEELKALLEETLAAFAQALAGAYGASETAENPIARALRENLTKTQIMRTIELLQKYRQHCLFRVNTSQELGALAVELEGIF